jgi:hypothetical protein
MRLPVIKIDNTTLTIIIVLTLSPLCLLLLVRLGQWVSTGCLRCEFVRLVIFQDHRETDSFFPDSGDVFSSQIKAKVGHILAKVTVLRRY